MAGWQRTNFRPERGAGNSEPPIIANTHYPGNSHGTQNMGIMYQPPNFMPTFVPHDRPPPPVRPSDFSGANSSDSNIIRSSMTPYTSFPQWPPSGNPGGVPNYPPGAQHVGVLPPEGPPPVVPFDASVPPPHAPFTAPPTFQPCIPSHGIQASDSSVGKSEVPGPFEENDKEWIDSWIRHCPLQATSHPASVSCTKSKIKVWNVKQSLQTCMSLLRELEVLERELVKGCEVMDETQWSWKMMEAEKMKMMLKERLGALDAGVLSRVRRALLQRSRKRARQRGRRVLDRELVAARAEKRRQLHLEADMWLEEKQAEVDLHKREEMMKREADAVLWEVRRKQGEGRRILSLLSALVKLHQVRVKKRDLDSNPALSENEDQFQIIIDKLSSLWERQMAEYNVEERALRVMLRESPEGGGGGAKSRAQRATGDLQRSLRLWESTLFGSGSMSEEILSLGAGSCQWLYLQPSKSLDALVENRRQWDQFISTSQSASSIPAGWVIPAEASSEEWKDLIGPRVECS